MADDLLADPPGWEKDELAAMWNEADEGMQSEEELERALAEEYPPEVEAALVKLDEEYERGTS